MARILAIDYGNVRIGLAVTDPIQIIATTLETIESAKIWNYLDAYLAKENVEEIVVGYPRQMNNQPSEAVKYIDPFVGRLRKKYPDIKIALYDERFTSQIAMQAMIAGGVKKSQRQDKMMVDKISANLILQSYLEFKKLKH